MAERPEHPILKMSADSEAFMRIRDGIEKIREACQEVPERGRQEGERDLHRLEFVAERLEVPMPQIAPIELERIKARFGREAHYDDSADNPTDLRRKWVDEGFDALREALVEVRSFRFEIGPAKRVLLAEVLRDSRLSSALISHAREYGEKVSAAMDAILLQNYSAVCDKDGIRKPEFVRRLQRQYRELALMPGYLGDMLKDEGAFREARLPSDENSDFFGLNQAILEGLGLPKDKRNEVVSKALAHHPHLNEAQVLTIMDFVQAVAGKAGIGSVGEYKKHRWTTLNAGEIMEWAQFDAIGAKVQHMVETGDVNERLLSELSGLAHGFLKTGVHHRAMHLASRGEMLFQPWPPEQEGTPTYIMDLFHGDPFAGTSTLLHEQANLIKAMKPILIAAQLTASTKNPTQAMSGPDVIQ